MSKTRKYGVTFVFFMASFPLLGGTGRPSDGFLSFILLLGLLVMVFGFLSLVDFIKQRIRKFLQETGNMI